MAAGAVVWVHTTHRDLGHAWADLGRFGTAFFTLLVVYFVFRGVHVSRERRYGQYLAERARRLYLPFIVWNLVTICLRWAGAHAAGEGLAVAPVEWFIGAGGQLWFLPFALALCATCWPLAQLMRWSPRLGLGLAVVVGVLGVALAMVPPPVFSAYGECAFILTRAWSVLPAACWGITLGHLLVRRPSAGFSHRVLLLGGAAVFATCIGLMWAYGNHSLTRNVAGLALMAMALCEPRGPVLKKLGRLGKYSFGIFLIHYLILAVLCRLPLWNWQPDVLRAAVLFSLVLGLSYLATRLLYAHRATQWLVR
jgi:peptidoglycan/LPS O-acetylase OafA/YrhL